jgi:nitrogen fixation NifU-like protein
MDNLYRDFILEHYRNPHNRGVLDPHDLHFADSNPTCGDELSMTIQLDDAKVRVVDVAHDGRGCAISQASASILKVLETGGVPSGAARLLWASLSPLVLLGAFMGAEARWPDEAEVLAGANEGGSAP